MKLLLLFHVYAVCRHKFPFPHFCHFALLHVILLITPVFSATVHWGYQSFWSMVQCAWLLSMLNVNHYICSCIMTYVCGIPFLSKNICYKTRKISLKLNNLEILGSNLPVLLYFLNFIHFLRKK